MLAPASAALCVCVCVTQCDAGRRRHRRLWPAGAWSSPSKQQQRRARPALPARACSDSGSGAAHSPSRRQPPGRHSVLRSAAASHRIAARRSAVAAAAAAAAAQDIVHIHVRAHAHALRRWRGWRQHGACSCAQLIAQSRAAAAVASAAEVDDARCTRCRRSQHEASPAAATDTTAPGKSTPAATDTTAAAAKTVAGRLTRLLLLVGVTVINGVVVVVRTAELVAGGGQPAAAHGLRCMHGGGDANELRAAPARDVWGGATGTCVGGVGQGNSGVQYPRQLDSVYWKYRLNIMNYVVLYMKYAL